MARGARGGRTFAAPARAVLCIDERAWAGKGLGPAAERREAPRHVVVTDGERAGHRGWDRRNKKPPQLDKVAGVQMVTRTGLEPMLSA
jgi:hypothetical protein